MKSRFYLIVFALYLGTLWAEEVWISDRLRTAVHEEAGVNKRFLTTLEAGEAVQKLERSRDGEYIKIKKGKLVGWVAARNVMDTPSIHAQWAQQEQQLSQLNAEVARLESALQEQQQLHERVTGELELLRRGEQNARDELLALQRASSNVMAIDQRNRELEQYHAEQEQQNLALRHRILRLEEALHQRQIYLGAIFVLLGFLSYWLLEHFSARRRRYYD